MYSTSGVSESLRNINIGGSFLVISLSKIVKVFRERRYIVEPC